MQTNDEQDVYVGTALQWEQARVTIDNDTLTVRVAGSEPEEWTKVLILNSLRTLVSAPGGATYEGTVHLVDIIGGLFMDTDEGDTLRISTRSNKAGCVPCGAR